MEVRDDTMTESSEVMLGLPPGPHGPELHDIVARSQPLHRLFRAMEADPILARFLLLSKFDLFEAGEDHNVPLFHAVRARGGALDVHNIAEIVSATHDTNVADLPERMFGPMGEDSAIANLTSGVVYAALAGLSSDDSIRKIVSGRNLSYARWQQIVRKAGGIGPLLANIAQRAQDSPALDEAYRAAMNRAGEDLAAEISRRMDEIAVMTKHPLPNVLMIMHKLGSAWVDHICALAEIDLEELERVLDRLVKLDLVETQSCIAWCHRCQTDRDAFQLLHGTFGPSRYAGHTCFACTGPVSYAAILYPIGSLREALLAHDGFLAAYTDWKLSNRTKQSYFQAGGRENDFYTNRDTLVEVKMFQTSRDDGTIRRSIGTQLNRLRKKIPKIKEDLPDMARLALVTNLSTSSMERARQKYPELDGIPLVITGMDDVGDL